MASRSRIGKAPSRVCAAWCLDTDGSTYDRQAALNAGLGETGAVFVESVGFAWIFTTGYKSFRAAAEAGNEDYFVLALLHGSLEDPKIWRSLSSCKAT